MHCPAQLHYSNEKQRCEYPCNAHCERSLACECKWGTCNVDSCVLPRVIGPCYARIPRFYFNKDSMRCERFFFGGCQGNENNFKSYRNCHDTCELYHALQSPIADSQSVLNFDCTKDGVYRNPEDCATFIQCSNGQAYIQPCPNGLHFSVETEKCQSKCDARCDQNLADECGWESTLDSIREENVCRLLPDKGSCDAFQNRFYFDFTTGHCRKFMYHGCRGNQNNFRTRKECEDRCLMNAEQSDSLSTKYDCFNNEIYTNPDDCGSYIKCTEGNAEVIQCPSGQHFSMALKRCTPPCDAYCDPSLACQCKWPNCDNSQAPQISTEDSRRVWNFECVKDGLYRNPEDCTTFVQCSNGLAYYQPCPTGLHFSVETEKCESKCDAHCDGSLADECEWDESVICQFSADKGPCFGKIKRYFFDAKSGSCKRFEYGGCRGNMNNFITKDECEEKCKHEEGDSVNNIHQQMLKLEPLDTAALEYASKDDWSVTSTEEDSPQIPVDDSVQVSSKFTCYKDGLYPDPEDCGRFIQCSNGLKYGIPCPSGLHFSEGAERCLGPCDAHCNKTIACQCGWPECSELEVDCEAHVQTGPCKDYEYRYYYNRGSGTCLKFRYGGCGGNTNNFATADDCKKMCQEKLIDGYRCPSPNGKFADFLDCISYYHCKRGVPTLKRCPGGFAFDHKKAKCVIEYEAECMYKCRVRDAAFTYHPDCRKYIDCMNGIAKVVRCPEGQAFDKNVNNCVTRTAVNCPRV